MKTTVRLYNREFPDSFLVTVNGVTKELSEDHEEITFEWDGETAEGEIAYVNHDEIKVKNPFLRFLAHLLAGLLSILIFWADNDGGIRCERCFKDINSFEIKKRFRLCPSEDGIIEVHFSDPKYRTFDKSYDPPCILLTGDLTEEESEIYYNPKHMCSAYRMYNYPVFTVLFLLSAFVNWIGVMVSITVVMRIPTSSLLENIGSITGMALCRTIIITVSGFSNAGCAIRQMPYITARAKKALPATALSVLQRNEPSAFLNLAVRIFSEFIICIILLLWHKGLYFLH